MFDKPYKNRKDWRKPYIGSAQFDRNCRNHGGCSYCCDNRMFKNKRRAPIEE